MGDGYHVLINYGAKNLFLDCTQRYIQEEFFATEQDLRPDRLEIGESDLYQLLARTKACLEIMPDLEIIVRSRRISNLRQ